MLFLQVKRRQLSDIFLNLSSELQKKLKKYFSSLLKLVELRSLYFFNVLL